MFGRPLGGFGPNDVEEVKASLTDEEMLCPECDGEGIIQVGHSFLEGCLYDSCHFCHGSGKVEIKFYEEWNRIIERAKLQHKLDKLPAVEKYEHHGTEVNVQKRLRGQHRDHCLCFQECVYFKPGEDDNCEIAQTNYEMCVKFSLTTPVYECPKYEQLTAE